MDTPSVKTLCPREHLEGDPFPAEATVIYAVTHMCLQWGRQGGRSAMELSHERSIKNSGGLPQLDVGRARLDDVISMCHLFVLLLGER